MVLSTIRRNLKTGGRMVHGAPDESPLRGELFSPDQLRTHARVLAGGHKVVIGEAPNQLLSRLDENEKSLRAYDRTTQSMDAARRITPATEWLRDNFFLIEDQIQMARKHLPRRYSRELPRLVGGASADLPRIYDIMLRLISHVDAQIDEGSLSAFVGGYQEVQPLKLGEIWAIPIMLRLGLIENLQRITRTLARARVGRHLANQWVDRLEVIAAENPSDVVVVVAEMARSNLRLTAPFVTEFCQRLATQGPVLQVARHWLEQRLASEGFSVEQLLHRESQSQAANQVSVSHTISSLRFLNNVDWKCIVESLSMVEQILRSEPSQIYGKMDFQTRDSCRHTVESIARQSNSTESTIAMLAVDLARDAYVSEASSERIGHVGNYLIGKGRPELERIAKSRKPIREIVARTIQRFPFTFYAGGIGVATVAMTSAFFFFASLWGLGGWELGILTVLFMVCSSQVALEIANTLFPLLVRPERLPQMDYSAGMPPECRTMVIVPTMLTRLEGVDDLLEALEIHYLGNRDESLHFALLTDFADADAEIQPGDDELIQRARSGVEKLNQKYGSPKARRFYLFHRPRKWNSGEERWMGYERKRGKLMEFNSLLRSGNSGCFSETVGDLSILGSIKYVITLDTDTRLPADSARELVGAISHPLNRPKFDETRGLIVEGYGILQPRVGVTLPSARASWYARIFSGPPGIDPYTRQVSDVYQDLFSEGSFIGKGIYDVDAFEMVMNGRFPENTILSHDLLEGCHARSGLISDLVLYEDHPSRYNVDVVRRHRWIRGDWQIIHWLFGRVPGLDGRVINVLSALSRWKIFDNLRRSIVPVFQLLFLLTIWLIFPEFSVPGTLLFLGLIFASSIINSAIHAGSRSSLPLGVHLREVASGFINRLAKNFLTIAFVPFDALISVDAILRTLSRLVLTKKRLLQWTTSSESERKPILGAPGYFRLMWICPVLAVSVICVILVTSQYLPYSALPILFMWACGPLGAWFISLPIRPAASGLTEEQVIFLRKTSRRTWHFFETFVTGLENWLPPDNYQEIPVPVIASRTSPTNIGLALLANLGAVDFGYLTGEGLIRRTRNTLATLDSLERHRGHFYNWYDTRSLEPLVPLYVSSVDSGNLAGHLLIMASGLREQADAPILNPEVFAGIRDTIEVIKSLDVEIPPAITRLERCLEGSVTTLRSAYDRLGVLLTLVAAVRADSPGCSEAFDEWTRTLLQNCQSHLDELRELAPWLELTDNESVNSDLSISAEHGEPGLEVTLRGLSNWGLTGSDLAVLNDEVNDDFSRRLLEARGRALSRLEELESLALRCDEMAAMDFTFLYDSEREMFAIGFNQQEGRLDNSYYDLLASEARLGSFVAIALGQIPQKHWFSMARLLVATGGEPLLVSWSGSMFEYLMPLLVMPNFEGTLLGETTKAAVAVQIKYGRSRGVPWGVSESGYNWTDAQSNYQYRAFGVPGLGLKQGLAEDLVITPYASALALLIAPKEACENLIRLEGEGLSGAFGFYEAVDYTPARVPAGETSVTIRSYMVHHQGMSFLSFLSLLRGCPMQRRFNACPSLKAMDLLLQERVPRNNGVVSVGDSTPGQSRAAEPEEESDMRVFTDPHPPAPEVHLLSNGRYHVAITSAGGGYSRWGDIALTRWREDSTKDCWGSFIYLRDSKSGEFWSAAYQPTLQETKGYESIFTQARAEFRHHYAGLGVHTSICVSPEDDVELRRITLFNRTASSRMIEVTSYAEVVLSSQAADVAHPAFGNLFVQTEFLRESSALLCTRRTRSAEESPVWLLHQIIGKPGELGTVTCETNRSKFVGRGGSLVSPAALNGPSSLSDSSGSVLDPSISLRGILAIPPHGSVTIDFVLGVAANRDAALGLVSKYQSPHMGDRAFDLASTDSLVTLHLLNASAADAHIFGRLASAIIYADPERRAQNSVLHENRLGKSSLWRFGISGDVPLIVLSVSDAERVDIVVQLVKAHSYLRMMGLMVELVILIDDTSVYRQAVQDRIMSLINAGMEAPYLDIHGGIFVRRIEQIPTEERVLLHTVARVVLDDSRGTLFEQLRNRSFSKPPVPALVPVRRIKEEVSVPLPTRELLFFNGKGGFTRDGHEYVITLVDSQTTPAPWVNVIANPEFGTVVSESGSAYTWHENAHENRLTPWSNDPVRDPTGEAFYLRDEETGKFWSPTPQPVRGTTPYVTRHGFGYSVFEHTEAGISSEMWVYVAMDVPVKLSVLKVRNLSDRSRRLSVTGYVEWVLGDQRHNSLLHTRTEMDLESGAIFARNLFDVENPDRVAFFGASGDDHSITGDRNEFIGVNGNLASPAAMKRVRLSGTVGAGLDPCGAIQVGVELAAGEEREIIFLLGVGSDRNEARTRIRNYRKSQVGKAVLQTVWEYWNRTLGAVNVDTPDPAVNVMANGWLLYQTLGCRLWGRSGFYQSGGAFGFRDQLQDVMALLHAEPTLCRQHIVRAAARQFREGDVQHWWHPPGGRGVRTRFSDDYLWLPYVVCHYVAALNDNGILKEEIPYLEGRPLRPEEEAYYDLPALSGVSGTLYQHCVRAIEYGLKFGVHGLPLIGCGDWNDGMNLVGKEGRGESVWLAFFLFDVLTQFSPLARAQGDDAFAEKCLDQAREIRENIEANAWDGDWYRRAYFDNGFPLGSSLNQECQIDSLPQSWSVLSGAGDPVRSQQAMEEVDHRLIRRDAGLVQLFDPPFDDSPLDPGYIKGYIPGVRENGGQYTHAAIWVGMAFAKLGDREKTWEIFRLLNPVRHGGSPEEVGTYLTEPYVVAADVYSTSPHAGRGGWTWYTGSAGWMYRYLIETLLGVTLEGARLRLAPLLPAEWPGFKVHYRYRQTVYHISITRVSASTPGGVSMKLDGREISGTLITLQDDRQEHYIEMHVE